MEDAMKSKRDRAWKVPWKDDIIVLRDIAMKIVQWVDKFKQIGDIVLQSDPGHAALPWAAFRFLLQVVSLTFLLRSHCC
jgi:predicted nicotinamide N-methyase